ncbi:MAG: glyoxylate/hydroxypyruvate reductase A [Bacteroidota bacterium]|nr:glyoxylate/hydroxypyruvate reductase A [Bacteroidota bacterium]
MSIAIIAPGRNTEELVEHIRSMKHSVEVSVYPNHKLDASMAIVWNQPKGLLAEFKNLKLVSSLGAGVEHICKEELAEKIKVSRIVDPDLSSSMVKYINLVVLYYQKNFQLHIDQNEKKLWKSTEKPDRELKVGILGAGEMGQEVAKSLYNLGFEVLTFSNTDKEIEGVLSYNSSDHTITDFVSMVNCLICLLPLTPQTENILNFGLFQSLPKSSILINVARGGHLVEGDLFKAIESGYISDACLDVFREEPLPASHPFWNHENILVTPHIASITNQKNAAAIVLENYKRLKNNQSLLYEVDRRKGY